MKKNIIILLIIISLYILIPCAHEYNNVVFAQEDNNSTTPLMVIVIDDFGSFDRSGVKTMLSIEAPLTCAIMPNLDNSVEDMENAKRSNKEIILHMPMESHVILPSDWYGPVYIQNSDSPSEATKKLDECLKSIPEATGFNIHIGSGVCQNKTLMKAILGFAKEHNLLFLDSRTHLNTICEEVAKEQNIIYMGRDEFLEPDHNKSYAGVKQHIQNGINTAKDKGYSIVIGHVGAHGGENTANAIKDMIKEIKDQGVQLVTLKELYNYLSNK